MTAERRLLVNGFAHLRLLRPRILVIGPHSSQKYYGALHATESPVVVCIYEEDKTRLDALALETNLHRASRLLPRREVS